MTTRLGQLLAAAGLALAAACTETPSGERSPPPTASSSASDAGRNLTSADDGSTVRLRLGQHADLVQRDPLAADPVVRGSSVRLVGLDSARSSGLREWEVRAVATGTSTITAAEGSGSFTIVVEVRD